MKVIGTILFLLLIAAPHGVEANETDSLMMLNKLIKQNEGKVVYIDFWASWCVPCRKSFPWLNQMQATYGKDGFAVIAVNLDESPELANAFLDKWPANFAVTYDPTGMTAEHYQLKGMPSSFILDRSGEVATTHIGFSTSKIGEYEQHIKSLLNKPNL